MTRREQWAFVIGSLTAWAIALAVLSLALEPIRAHIVALKAECAASQNP